jgi:hypothetical protein
MVSKMKTRPTPTTLDAVASLMPEAWWWNKHDTHLGGVRWHAGPRSGAPCVTVSDTGDELRDRTTLANAARLIAEHDERKP